MRFLLGNFNCNDRLSLTHLLHQIVVPLAFNLEMRHRAEFHGFDEIE